MAATVVGGTSRRLSSSTTTTAPKAKAEAEHTENLRLIEEMTSDVDAVQERVLFEILTQNAGTEYLMNCGGPTDRATFQAMVPVVSYDSLKPYIHHIANGDRSPVLSMCLVSDFLTSSGTSGGERKLIPNLKDEGSRRRLLFSLRGAVINSYFPGIDEGKGVYFLFIKSETKIAGELPAWPVLTSIYKSEEHSKNPLQNSYTIPRVAMLCADTFKSMYAHMM